MSVNHTLITDHFQFYLADEYFNADPSGFWNAEAMEAMLAASFLSELYVLAVKLKSLSKSAAHPLPIH